MKKIALVAIVALAGTILLPSCKKDYTCVCTTSISGSADVVNEIALGKTSKKDAKAACDGRVVSVPGASMQCKLK